MKFFELLRTPSFIQMMLTYSPKEAMIISLRLGYVDGKCFSASAISEFLGIDINEVIGTTKKILTAYKEKMNELFDEAIERINEESTIIGETQGKTYHSNN